MGRRVIVYGDIHGCLREFKQLREKINPQKKDIEITVGDFINKGPDSQKTLRYLQKQKIQSVMGNNEAKIIKLYKRYQKKGDTYLDTLRDSERKTLLELEKKDIDYLKTLPYFLKIDKLTVLHGGIMNTMKLSEDISSEDKKLLTLLRFFNKAGESIPYDDFENREVFWSEVYEGHEGFIVFGHHPFAEVKIEKNAIGIDTGAVYGGKLTAVSFVYKDKKVQTTPYKLYSVKAMKNYFETA